MRETTATDPMILIEELRAEVRQLSERVAHLEAARGSGAPEPEPEQISDEVLLVIAAAVAAFLGERAHMRQVRLIRSTVWAQQGRVSIQASHRLEL